jgi:RNA polymerase sigma factor (TIGR02999 family)
MDDAEPVTVLLQRMSRGDVAAEEQLFAFLYGELRARARGIMGGGDGHTLQPTAVVHEAWLKLAGGETDWQGRSHFLAVAARAMRQVLVDHARAKRAEKRGGNVERVTLDEAVRVYEERAIDLVALDEALSRLADEDAELARLVELRFFGGLTIEETARVLDVSTPTVERWWRTARGRLRVDLDDGLDDADAG